MGFIERTKKALVMIKDNWAPLLSIALAYQAVDLSFMKMVAPSVSVGEISFFYVLLFILMWLIRVLFLCGYLPMVMDCVKGKKISLADFAGNLTRPRYFSLLFIEAIVIIVMIAGMLLLIAPGIYWAVISSLAYFIVASSSGYSDVFKSITDSIELTKGKRWHILGYQVIYFSMLLLASLSPILSLTLGVFVTALYWIIMGLVYKESL